MDCKGLATAFGCVRIRRIFRPVPLGFPTTGRKFDCSIVAVQFEHDPVKARP
jgi:hypothetical protein